MVIWWWSVADFSIYPTDELQETQYRDIEYQNECGQTHRALDLKIEQEI